MKGCDFVVFRIEYIWNGVIDIEADTKAKAIDIFSSLSYQEVLDRSYGSVPYEEITVTPVE